MSDEQTTTCVVPSCNKPATKSIFCDEHFPGTVVSDNEGRTLGRNDPLSLPRYTAVDYGLLPDSHGHWLDRKEVIAAINYILQDDSKTEERLRTLLENLNK